MDFHANAINDLCEYLGAQPARNGQVELRDKWNAWSGSVEGYYMYSVGDSYLFDLAAWHASGTLVGWTDVVMEYANGSVIDFGGGIGTYSLVCASLPRVNRVFFHDINADNIHFASFRFNKYALADKITVGLPETKADTLIAIDVLEHMPDRMEAIASWVDMLRPGGLLIFTYTSHTSNGEHPMHLMTDEEIVPIHEALTLTCEPIVTSRPEVWRVLDAK